MEKSEAKERYDFWIYLKPEELERFFHLDGFYIKLYLVLRENMDGNTKIVNMRYYTIGTFMELERIKGSRKKCGKPSLKQLRDGIDFLIKKGLIERLSGHCELILKLPFSPDFSEKTQRRISLSPGGRAHEGQAGRAAKNCAPQYAPRPMIIWDEVCPSDEDIHRGGADQISRGGAAIQEVKNVLPDSNINDLSSLPLETMSNFQKKPISSESLAQMVLDYLNEKTGRKLGDKHLAHIKARLKEGATVEQCKAVINLKVAEWLHHDVMWKHLTPDTLFNRTKFNKYLSELEIDREASKQKLMQQQDERIMARILANREE